MFGEEEKVKVASRDLEKSITEKTKCKRLEKGEKESSIGRLNGEKCKEDNDIIRRLSVIESCDDTVQRIGWNIDHGDSGFHSLLLEEVYEIDGEETVIPLTSLSISHGLSFIATKAKAVQETWF
ncbi:hypothetical protein Ancab_012639 [Ancistrocladus abbreviatus]